MLLLGRKDTHRVAFHRLLPQDHFVQMSQKLRGGVWNKQCNIGQLPLFANRVSSCPLLPLKAEGTY